MGGRRCSFSCDDDTVSIDNADIDLGSADIDGECCRNRQS